VNEEPATPFSGLSLSGFRSAAGVAAAGVAASAEDAVELLASPFASRSMS
jgi:hypothetical protein